MSDGDLGAGGRLGTNYLFSERTTLYLNYALENERTDNGLRGGRRGNLVSGVKRALSGQLQRLPRGALPGHRLADRPHARDRHDPRAERALEPRRQRRHRHADRLADRREDRSRGRRVPHGLRLRGVQFSSAVEYRSTRRSSSTTRSPSARPGCSGTASSSSSPRTGAWSASSTTPSARARSGEFYDGGYTEAVIGYGYRPVRERPAERAGQVHVLLQRADDGPGDAGHSRRSSSRRATSRRST